LAFLALRAGRTQRKQPFDLSLAVVGVDVEMHAAHLA
jgi:hypothetical protein